jgi:hypothetical protein
VRLRWGAVRRRGFDTAARIFFDAILRQRSRRQSFWRSKSLGMTHVYRRLAFLETQAHQIGVAGIIFNQ